MSSSTNERKNGNNMNNGNNENKNTIIDRFAEAENGTSDLVTLYMNNYLLSIILDIIQNIPTTIINAHGITKYCVPAIIFSTPDENPGIRIVCSPAPEIG